MVITDMETWLLDNSDRVIRYWVYKRMFTPYERKECFEDESIYDNDECTFAYIREAIDLGNGNWMLGLQPLYDGDDSLVMLEYRPLSEIAIEYFPSDTKKFREGFEDDE